MSMKGTTQGVLVQMNGYQVSNVLNQTWLFEETVAMSSTLTLK
jgi:hypothetical protein